MSPWLVKEEDCHRYGPGAQAVIATNQMADDVLRPNSSSNSVQKKYNDNAALETSQGMEKIIEEKPDNQSHENLARFYGVHYQSCKIILIFIATIWAGHTDGSEGFQGDVTYATPIEEVLKDIEGEMGWENGSLTFCCE
ncbi:hypothetical protein BHYA_0279g00130 [Botrytis hyacinthi]|uniref:Uncharacterized protein n=1 Tax=Botrytis hyacinthi TaxID=278943 RepID=A0A4Z1GEU0_9HELO|nr:hypothetical protein BHYA_0279g00130 [Botrytis hyacinthi]